MSTITVGGTTTGTAVTKDASGNIITGSVVTWSSNSPAIATVNSATGVATGLSVGSAIILATSENRIGQDTLTVFLVPVTR